MKNRSVTYWPQHLPKELTYRHGQMPLHIYVEKNAETNPNAVAYNYYGNGITWEQVNDAVNRIGQFLINQGITKGDKVALYLQNSPQYIIGYYAIQRVGAVVVPLNPMLKEAELQYAFQEGEITGVIVSQELVGRIENIQHEVEQPKFIMVTNYRDLLAQEMTLDFPEELLLPKNTPDFAYDFLDIIQNVEPLQSYEELDIWEDVALLVFTSGTTGRPKGAMLTHGNTLYKTAAKAMANQIEFGGRSLSVAPFSHIAGMLMGVNISVYQMLETVILSQFNPVTVVDAIEKYKIATWYSIAIMNAAILAIPNIHERDLTSLQVNMATSFGVSVTEQLQEKWALITDGCLLFEASYGLSESHTGDTFMPQDKIKYGSVGIPVYDVTINIVDEDGNTVPPGEQGEIMIHSLGNFKGYFKRPEETSAVLKDGWLATGDIGRFDEDGYLYYLGRTKEMIKSSGYSIFPDDVEALLSAHPAIAQSVVVGVPDPKRGESVKAFIVLRAEHQGKVTEEDIIAWSKKQMADYKYPRHVAFLDQLPTTSTGKVLRRLVKEIE